MKAKSFPVNNTFTFTTAPNRALPILDINCKYSCCGVAFEFEEHPPDQDLRFVALKPVCDYALYVEGIVVNLRKVLDKYNLELPEGNVEEPCGADVEINCKDETVTVKITGPKAGTAPLLIKAVVTTLTPPDNRFSVLVGSEECNRSHNHIPNSYHMVTVPATSSGDYVSSTGTVRWESVT